MKISRTPYQRAEHSEIPRRKSPWGVAVVSGPNKLRSRVSHSTDRIPRYEECKSSPKRIGRKHLSKHLMKEQPHEENSLRFAQEQAFGFDNLQWEWRLKRSSTCRKRFRLCWIIHFHVQSKLNKAFREKVLSGNKTSKNFKLNTQTILDNRSSRAWWGT